MNRDPVLGSESYHLSIDQYASFKLYRNASAETLGETQKLHTFKKSKSSLRITSVVLLLSFKNNSYLFRQKQLGREIKQRQQHATALPSIIAQ